MLAQGSFAGNAKGFKLESILKLGEKKRYCKFYGGGGDDDDDDVDVDDDNNNNDDDDDENNHESYFSGELKSNVGKQPADFFLYLVEKFYKDRPSKFKNILFLVPRRKFKNILFLIPRRKSSSMLSNRSPFIINIIITNTNTNTVTISRIISMFIH
eukprot:758578-Hanusia_phi.AAC.3